MFKKLGWLALTFLLAFPSPVLAQTAAQVVTGYLTTVGCPGNITPCFVQYGSSGSSGIPTVPSTAPTTNSSASTTTGGTFQLVAAASTTRKSVEFANICNVTGNCSSATDLCYINFQVSGSADKTNSIALNPGYGYLRSSGVIPSDAINVTCDTTGDKFYFKVQ